ncbi:MAG TPA: hypothetical protein VGK34_07090 [Armatimonadota bacterium]|jgi:hypothetical protein
MNTDTQIDPAIAGEFSSHLLPDEQVLWTGQQGRRSSNRILPAIIGIAMLLFAAFWLHGVLPMFRDLGRAPGVFGYFPLIFLGAFLIMFIGPLVRVIRAFAGVRSGRIQSTYYAVTNKRAMVLSTARRHTLRTAEIASSPSIDRWTNREGTGYIVVGDMQGSASSLAVASALGIDPSGASYRNGVGNAVIFMDIPNAEAVYNLIRAQVPTDVLTRMDSGEAVEIAPKTSAGNAKYAPPAIYLPPPPRSVPWYIALSAIFGKGVTQFGWVFFGFGLIFVWIFSAQTDFSRPIFWGGVDVVQGRILTTAGTNVSMNHSAIYGFTYSYRDAQGMEQKGKSYTAWQRYNPGEQCTVEIAKWNHSFTRIQGAGRSPLGLFGLFPVLFPLIGLLIIASAFWKGLKGIRLIKTGNFAYAKYTHAKRATDLVKEHAKNAPRCNEENERQVYRLYFTFTTSDGRTCETYTDSAYPKELHDEKYEMLVYNPEKPEDAVLLDSLPGKIRVDDDGRLVMKQGSPLGALGLLVIPLVCVVGHGLYIYQKFFHGSLVLPR